MLFEISVLEDIDSTHIKIDTPFEDPVSYFNRKKYHSIHISKQGC